ncbi:DsbA family protein [Alteromonas gilva]|uniref:DsbA family protein n=1 Tax=Alteromonas gilva TaxID=2987522 RepID=A0ABT5L4K7_9ALTE|nr:DsbA family protein [Alteromonas gilva]MDC8830797.1 DsbA family protein [Alteromonas gilva]
MNSRLLVIAGIAILLAIGGAFYLFAKPTTVTAAAAPASASASPAAESAAPSTESTQAGIPDMTLGNPMSTVKVVEYASFTCPHCASFHNNQFKQLKANYIDTGKISFTFREVYFDKFGLLASMIGRCEGSKAFYFDYSEKVFARQREWIASRDGDKIVNELATMGKAAGLTDDQLGACMNDNAKAEALVQWYKHNAEQDNIRSTPSFVINGELHTNMPYEDFAELLDDKLGL